MELTPTFAHRFLPLHAQDVRGFVSRAGEVDSGHGAVEVPPWILKRLPTNSRRVRLREWEDLAWREACGWVGTDLCHNMDGNAVRVLRYWWDEEGQALYGAVHFGPGCESHAGWCHGGAMT